MKRKNIIVLVLASVFMLVAAGVGGVKRVSAATTADALLKAKRDQAATVVKQVASKASAEKYIEYLNNLIDQADCYLDGPLATCDYSEENVEDLAAALDEGARATVYLTADYKATTTTRPTQESTNVAVSNAENKNTTTNVAGRPDSLPNASYETSNASERYKAGDQVAETEQESEIKTKTVEPVKVAMQEEADTGGVEQSKTEKSSPARIVVAVLAGAAILAAGVVVIWKWSRNDV